MVNKLTNSIFLNPHINRQGQSKLYLQVTINRRVKRYPLELYTIPENWDSARHIIKAGKEKETINRMLTRELAKANDIYLKLREQELDITFENFENLYLKKNNTKLSQVVDLHCQNLQKQSRAHYYTVKSEVENLFGDIEINNLTIDKIQQYHLSIQDNKNNTIWGKHKCLKAIINTAIKYNLFKNETPYKNFKTKYVQTIRTHLDLEELTKIENSIKKANIPIKVKKTAIAFLFQCYTGLRHSDIKNLTWKDLTKNSIVIKTEKTDEIINIPLTKRARTLLDFQDRQLKNVFDIPTNQKFNDYLKLVADYSGIEKNLTSHVARHTFATISIEIGIPIEVISKLLGHQKLKTTKIYTKITDPLLNCYMEYWDK